jgi:hypothetical protein
MKGRQPHQHELESGKLSVAYNVTWIAPENTELPTEDVDGLTPDEEEPEVISFQNNTRSGGHTMP